MYIVKHNHRWRLRVKSGVTAPGPALEGAPRFRPKVVLMSLSSIPTEIPILWPRAVMVGPRPHVLLTPLLNTTIFFTDVFDDIHPYDLYIDYSYTTGMDSSNIKI
jgi:hypothetical protein